jgi:single-stranded DNA-specific DHH superfamily exonuclease
MTRSTHVLIQHGGHKMAGGFAVEDIHVLSLQEVFVQAFEDLNSLDVVKNEQPVVNGVTSGNIQNHSGGPTVHQLLSTVHSVPTDISVSDISLSFIKNLRKIAPFGVGNPEPEVRVCGVVASVSQFGKEKNHFELTLAGSSTSKVQARCMAFFSSPESFTYAPNVGDVVCVTGTLSESRFAGRVRAELRVEDIEKV